jgi:8-oxo-dGTP pyrophosphatase MutT (NUDIX family)
VPAAAENNSLPNRLREALTETRPGKTAQLAMAPSARPPEDSAEYVSASVLIALFSSNGHWWFPLIRRVEDGYPHGGQIGLPGGRDEPGENAIDSALREANEEVGIDRDAVEVLGELTPLAVPVSGYRVTPVVGVLSGQPELRPQPTEVETILLAGVHELVDESRLRTENWSFFGKASTVPMFNLGGTDVWGATAMMLGEFRELLLRAGVNL